MRLGPLTVRSVPVSVMALDRPVIGTGLLRQFLADASTTRAAGSCSDRARASPGQGGVEVPFALAATHLLLASGALDDREPLTFIVDSGLEDEGGASVALPRQPSTSSGSRRLR